MILEGSAMQVNLALKAGILVKNYTIFEDISVEVHVQDGINYDIYEERKLSEVGFFKKSMSIGNNISIKKQFYDKYQDGVVGIDTEMSF